MRKLALILVLAGCSSEAANNSADSGVHPGDGEPAGDGDPSAGDGSFAADGGDGSIVHGGDADVEDAAGSQPGHDAGAQPPLRLGCTSECTTALADTVAEGTTPWGHFVAEQVGVVYVLGFTNSTDIFVLGQIEGKPVELYVTTMSSLTEFVTPPGTYTPALSSSSVWGHVYGLDTNEVCSSEPLDWITVTIQAHQGPAGSAAPGTPVELTGSLALDGDGWDLQIPFAIRGVCDKLTSI